MSEALVPKKEPCPMCRGVGALGTPGAPCDMCGGTGENPDWLRALAQGRHVRGPNAIAGPDFWQP